MKENYNTHKEKTVSADIERPCYIHAVTCSWATEEGTLSLYLIDKHALHHTVYIEDNV